MRTALQALNRWQNNPSVCPSQITDLSVREHLRAVDGATARGAGGDEKRGTKSDRRPNNRWGRSITFEKTKQAKVQWRSKDLQLMCMPTAQDAGFQKSLARTLRHVAPGSLGSAEERQWKFDSVSTVSRQRREKSESASAAVNVRAEAAERRGDEAGRADLHRPVPIENRQGARARA